MRTGVLLTLMVIVGVTALSAQDQQVRIDVLMKGEAVMWFVPAEDRSRSSSRGVCSEVEEAGAKTKDGEPIRWLELTGWREGDGYRVTVSALVTTAGMAASQRLCSEGNGYKRVKFADVHLRPGQEIPIPKMKEASPTKTTSR